MAIKKEMVRKWYGNGKEILMFIAGVRGKQRNENENLDFLACRVRGGLRFPYHVYTISLQFPYHFLTIPLLVATCAKSENKM